MNTQQTILVIEDDAFVRMQIISFLKEAGYTILEATDGYKALEIMNENVSLVIMDVHMKPMDGFEFISVLQESGFMIPTVLITGDGDSELRARADKLGIANVLTKPVRKDGFISMVGRLVSPAG